MLKGRFPPSGRIEGFTAEIGASGSYCPQHATLPVEVTYFDAMEHSAPSPFLVGGPPPLLGRERGGSGAQTLVATWPEFAREGVGRVGCSRGQPYCVGCLPLRLVGSWGWGWRQSLGCSRGSGHRECPRRQLAPVANGGCVCVSQVGVLLSHPLGVFPEAPILTPPSLFLPGSHRFGCLGKEGLQHPQNRHDPSGELGGGGERISRHSSCCGPCSWAIGGLDPALLASPRRGGERGCLEQESGWAGWPFQAWLCRPVTLPSRIPPRGLTSSLSWPDLIQPQQDSGENVPRDLRLPRHASQPRHLPAPSHLPGACG